MAKLLHGVTTAMITPFRADKGLDLEAVAALTEFLIAKKVHCLYPLGTTGEMLKLTTQERMAAAKQVVDTARGRVTVYIHTGAATPEEALLLSRHAAEIGADGVGVVTPAFFGLSGRELVAYYQGLANALPADFPLYLYNIPQCAGNDLTAGDAAAIAGLCPNVAGIKYSQPDLLRTDEYLQIREGSFSVLQGTDRLFLAALAMGCAGTVSGISCAFPEPFVGLCDAFLAGDLPRARRLQKLANRVCLLLGCGSQARLKAALEYRGVLSSPVREPQLDLPAGEKEALFADLAEWEKALGVS